MLLHHPENSGQETIPLNALIFRQYLARHHLTPLDVALASGVRYLTIWRIWEGQPVKSEYERPVRATLVKLTGEPYHAPILIREEREKQRRNR